MTDFMPPPGPNGIGQFQIGISPIGDQPFNWQDTNGATGWTNVVTAA